MPTTTYGLVERHLVGQLGQTGADQALLGTEQRTLGIEPGQVTVHTLLITELRQLEIGLVGFDQSLLCLQLLLIVRLGTEGIRNLLEGGLDALLVARHRLPGTHFSHIKIGDTFPTVEDGQVDLGDKRPGAGSSVKQAAQLVAGRPRRRGERDGGEEGGARRAYIGIGRLQTVLGSQNIRALLQQARRRTHRDRRQFYLGQGHRLAVQHRNLGAKEQCQTIAILLHLALVLGQADPGTFQCGTPLGKLHLGGRAQAILVLGQAITLLLGRQGRLAQRQQLLIRQQGEIGIGHRRYQRNLGAAPGLNLGKVGLQSLIFQALDPAKQVQLIGCDAEIGIVLAADSPLPRAAEIVGSLLAGARAVRCQGRQLRRPLNTVPGFIRLDVESRDPQIPVILQCGVDEPLQRRVEKLLLPGGDGRLPCCLIALPGGALGQFGSLIVRGHGTGPQQQCHAQGDQRLSHDGSPWQAQPALPVNCAW